MSSDLQTIVHALSATTLNGPGRTPADLRLEQASENGRTTIAPNLLPHLNKASLNAYQILDRETDNLQANNPNNDQTFELTISAALGAGLVRLERGLARLNELID